MTQMNVQQLAEQCRLLTQPREFTYLNWLKAIKSVAHLPVSEVNKATVLEYRMRHRKPTGTWCDLTFVNNVKYVTGIWNTAIEFDLIEGPNPWPLARHKIKLTKRQMRRHPDVHPYEFYEEFHGHPYFQCMWWGGMRIGEIAAIYKENIVLDAEIPYFNFVHQSNRTLKTESSIRKVPILPVLVPFLPELRLSQAARAHGAYFSDKLRKRLGLPKGHASHTLRHSFRSRMNDAGIIEPIQDALLGHEPDTLTGQYGSVTMEMKLAALQKLR